MCENCDPGTHMRCIRFSTENRVWHNAKHSSNFENKKNEIRAINEFKYKFGGVFKALKTNVSWKYFLTTFMLVSPVLFSFISWEQTFPGLIRWEILNKIKLNEAYKNSNSRETKDKDF
jgi:hypothetical protein